MKKAPTDQGHEALVGEQLSLIDPPPFCPSLPTKNSNADLALHDLLAGAITQLDWLARGRSWRLSAAVKELDYLGWQPKSVLVQHAGWPKPIAKYSLPPIAHQTAPALLRQNAAGGASA